MRTKQTIMKKRRDNITQRKTNITRHLTGAGKIMSLGLVVMLFTFVTMSSVSAESFQSTEQVQFTLNPSVSITLSGDLTIESLSPNDAKDSNIITVSVASNTANGYSLTSTVGSTSNASNQLRKDGTSTANIFSNLTANKGTLSDFDFNYWGYSYSTDSGSTWVSGNTGSTTSGYNGYTYDTASSTVTHINSTTSGSASIQYKIGAKAAGTQAAGNYTNVINFIGIGNVITTNYTINYNVNGGTGAPATQTGTTTTGAVTLSTTTPTKDNNLFQGWCTVDNTSDPSQCSGDTIKAGDAVALNSGTSTSITKTLYAVWEDNTPTPSKIYMQDATLADCGQTMYDKRDENDYTTALINGECYMTQNLRFTGTSLSTTTSNVSADRTISYGDLTSGNSYTEARIHNSGDTTKGVWYNFCAAGAKETGACTSSSTYTSSYDICPKNWHLPTNSQFSGITSYEDAFSPVTGGRYVDGLLEDTWDGCWWSATAYDAGLQYYLLYDGSSMDTDGYFKRYGLFVRCVQSS